MRSQCANHHRSYYCNQAGHETNSLPTIYKGTPYQAGYGRFSSILLRYGVPLLGYLAKKTFSTGSRIAKDIYLDKQRPKEAIRKRVLEAAAGLRSDVIKKAGEFFHKQTGRGKKIRKRKRLGCRQGGRPATKRRKIIRKQRDIFDRVGR